MQSSVAFGVAPAATSRGLARSVSLTFSYFPTVKKLVVKSSRNASRSDFTPCSNWAIVSSSSPPSGLSADL